MNEKTKIPADKEIVGEACAWLAQIESGSLSGADMAALREWISRSPAHAREIRAVAELSGSLSVLSELTTPLAAASGAASSLRKSKPLRAFAAPALAALAIFAVAAVMFIAWRQPGGSAPEIYRTAIGEYRSLDLTDGTVVKLNTNTQIEVDYSKDERRVRLVNGEALVDVAKNPDRPFIVYSDAAVAEAVGTSFALRLRDQITELSVVEGAVAFFRLPETIDAATDQARQNAAKNAELLQKQARVILRAGQSLTSDDIPAKGDVLDGAEIPVITQRDIQRRLSWTEGLLDFSQTPLREVVTEVTRHNDVSIEIADPALEDVKLGGIFRTGDVEPLLEALEGLGIDVERRSDGVILLHTAKTD
jgi:transmembrane sensor